MVMVDSVEQCDLIADAAGNQPIKVCMDVDAALRIGPMHIGVRRSPVHSPGQAYALAAEITKAASALPDWPHVLRRADRRPAGQLHRRSVRSSACPHESSAPGVGR